jgi:hypothetical protein
VLAPDANPFEKLAQLLPGSASGRLHRLTRSAEHGRVALVLETSEVLGAEPGVEVAVHSQDGQLGHPRAHPQRHAGSPALVGGAGELWIASCATPRAPPSSVRLMNALTT